MRLRDALEQALGGPVLTKLLDLVESGMIEKYHLQRMSSAENMNVSSTFVFNARLGRGTGTILERMLDCWYEDTLAQLSAGQARASLLSILERTCPRSVTAALKAKTHHRTGPVSSALLTALRRTADIANEVQFDF